MCAALVRVDVVARHALPGRVGRPPPRAAVDDRPAVEKKFRYPGPLDLRFADPVRSRTAAASSDAMARGARFSDFASRTRRGRPGPRARARRTLEHHSLDRCPEHLSSGRANRIREERRGPDRAGAGVYGLECRHEPRPGSVRRRPGHGGDAFDAFTRVSDLLSWLAKGRWWGCGRRELGRRLHDQRGPREATFGKIVEFGAPRLSSATSRRAPRGEALSGIRLS